MLSGLAQEAASVHRPDSSQSSSIKRPANIAIGTDGQSGSISRSVSMPHHTRVTSLLYCRFWGRSTRRSYGTQLVVDHNLSVIIEALLRSRPSGGHVLCSLIGKPIIVLMLARPSDAAQTCGRAHKSPQSSSQPLAGDGTWCCRSMDILLSSIKIDVFPPLPVA